MSSYFKNFRVYYRFVTDKPPTARHRIVKAFDEQDAKSLVRYQFAQVGEHVDILWTRGVDEAQPQPRPTHRHRFCGHGGRK